MKIAIFALPLHTDYGDILQACALQTTEEFAGEFTYGLSLPEWWIVITTTVADHLMR